MSEILKLSDEEIIKNQELINIIHQHIETHNGFMPFADFMQTVLYTPFYGYYSGGHEKIGSKGDFITAPELSPLFAQTLAQQLKDILIHTEKNIYEFGAGTGALAIELLKIIPESLLQHYYIIEISPELAHRQYQHIKQHIPQHIHRVSHLSELPDYFNGIILGNEVLDAIPCNLIEKNDDIFTELGVTFKNTQLNLESRILKNPALLQLAQTYFPQEITDYRSELHSQHMAFVRTLAEKIQQGTMIWIDYGFDQYEYYHEQRDMGTLIGHFRHHTIDDPLAYAGLMDLTAHINFSAIAQTATEAGLDLAGYTSQANFLINCGITTLLEQSGNINDITYIQGVNACQKLLAPHEMGELFKVIAFSKNLDINWQGFQTRDLSHKL